MVHESRLIQLFIHESCLNIKVVSSGHEKILLYFLKLPILLYFLKLPSYAAILVPPINLSILIFHSIPFPHNFALILFPRITHCRFYSWICEIWERVMLVFVTRFKSSFIFIIRAKLHENFCNHTGIIGRF